METMKEESIKALGGNPVEVDLETGDVNLLAPRILHKGVYTLYEKPDGTLRVQYRRTDRETDDSLEIPGFMLALAGELSSGKLNPMQAFAKIGAAMRKGSKVG
jgi:hypothetical protein